MRGRCRRVEDVIRFFFFFAGVVDLYCGCFFFVVWYRGCYVPGGH